MQEIIRYIYSLSNQNQSLDWSILFFGKYFALIAGGIFMLAAFRYYIIQNKQYLRITIIGLISAFFARYGITSVIRIFYQRLRPFSVLDINNIIYDSNYSFPSGHAIFFFTLGTVMFKINRKLAWFAYISGLVIGIARIAGGVHWPTDILGGVIIGVLLGIIINFIYPKIWKQ